jgi:hypothetical protein
MSDEIMASLLLPIPPNVLPVSKAAAIRKNLPRAKMEMRIIKSPEIRPGIIFVVTGTSRAAAKDVESTMYGVARNTQDAVSDTTQLFRISL